MAFKPAIRYYVLETGRVVLEGMSKNPRPIPGSELQRIRLETLELHQVLKLKSLTLLFFGIKVDFDCNNHTRSQHFDQKS
jgi:hypothetical protein